MSQRGSSLKEKHQHTFIKATKTVLLAKYRVQDGGMRDVQTTGRDTLEVYKCSCGENYATNLTRVIV